MSNIHRLTVLGLTLPCLLLTSGCASDMSSVSLEAQSAIDTRFPGATVNEVEGKLGNLYEISLVKDEQQFEVKLHSDGTIIEIETLIDVADLPEPVAATVAEKTEGHEVIKVEKVETLAQNTLGGVKPLDESEVFYEVKWRAGGFKRELKVNPDGGLR